MHVRLSNFFYIALAAAVAAMVLLSTATQSAVRDTAKSTLFYPVAKPLHLIVTPERPDRVVAAVLPGDAAQVQAIVDENTALQNQLAIFSAQLELMRQREAQAELLGQALASISTRVRVISADPEKTLQLGRVDGAAVGSPVVLPQRLVGRISSVGIAGQGATVQLITHPAFKCVAAFGRQIDNGPGKPPTFGYLQLPAVVVVGMKDSAEMRIDTLKLEQTKAAGLKVDDVLVLRDPDPAWGDAVQGIHLGIVTAIDARAGANGFAEIRIRPEIDLLHLREVLVARTR